MRRSRILHPSAFRLKAVCGRFVDQVGVRRWKVFRIGFLRSRGSKQLYDVCQQRKHNGEFGGANVFFAMKNAVTGLVFRPNSMDTIHAAPRAGTQPCPKEKIIRSAKRLGRRHFQRNTRFILGRRWKPLCTRLEHRRTNYEIGTG